MVMKLLRCGFLPAGLLIERNILGNVTRKKFHLESRGYQIFSNDQLLQEAKNAST